MRTIVLVFLILFDVMPARGADRLERLQVLDPVLRQIVEKGLARSPTFRDLVARVEDGEWLVFIQTGPCPDRAVRGCLLHVVGRFDGRRYLRVLVRPAGLHPDRAIRMIAHELQHVVEVISDPSVTDGASLLALQMRIASSRFRSTKAIVYETAAAQRIEDAVWRELRRSTRFPKTLSTVDEPR